MTFTDKDNKIHLLKYAEADPSGINGVHSSAPASEEYFDLSGKRVAAPSKGLFVKRTVSGGKVTTQKILK